jgi:serine/threonine-protein kinase
MAPVTPVPGAGASRTAAPATSAPTTPVRTTTTTHGGKAMAAALQESDLVPVSQVVKRARAPVVEFVVAVVLLALAAALAFGGVGKPSRSGDIAPGTVTVNGIDVASGRAAKLDLSKPIVVAGKVPKAVPADALKLGFSAAGISLGTATSKITPAPDHTFSASFNTSGSRYLMAGRATGEVSVLAGPATVAHQSFEVRSTQSPLATIPGAVSIASLLFIAGYPNSVLRAMRRGRRRSSGVVAFVLLGALFGVAAVVAAWLTSTKEPTLGTAVVCMVVGALAGVATGLGGLQLGRRRKPIALQSLLAEETAAAR